MANERIWSSTCRRVLSHHQDSEIKRPISRNIYLHNSGEMYGQQSADLKAADVLDINKFVSKLVNK